MLMDILITSKVGFEDILARESSLYHFNCLKKGQGWILVRGDDPKLSDNPETSLTDLCFAQYVLKDPVISSATSVNSFAEKLSNDFLAHIGQTRIVDPWPFLFISSDNDQFIHRAKTVQDCWLEKLSKKMSRVAKLSREGIPSSTKFGDGFFVHFTDFNQAFVSFGAFSQGQQRMSMDLKAPSRSFLKLEEAFHVFGCEPKANEIVVDLGAAPGGWSYSALKRGASVIAVDNGPLRDPVKSHKEIRHLQVDALSYKYDEGKIVDWLLCDIVEKPDMILVLLHKWLSQKRCRYFVVNLKVGRADPITLLKEIKDPQKGISSFCKRLVIRQLYHDREEITLMGEAEENKAEGN